MKNNICRVINEFFYESSDRKKIRAKSSVLISNNVKGVIQIAHGLGETIDYYDEFIECANFNGFNVFINEARGHDGSGDAGTDCFDNMKNDLHCLNQKIKSEYPDVPVFLLGHSMGSVIARLYACEYGNEINGLILTGVPFKSFNANKLLKIIEEEIKDNGLKAPSKITFNEMFSKVNKQFEPVKTELDWITSDENMIREALKISETFINFNNEFYENFILALLDIEDFDKLSSLPKDLPVYLLGGDKDVITNNGRCLRELYDFLKKELKINDLSLKIYKDKRHSILRETNRKKVADDILFWLNCHLLSNAEVTYVKA